MILRERLFNIDMLTVPNHTSLVQDILETGSMIRIKVTGNSMNPFLSSGDVVTLKRVEIYSLRKGDLVFYISHYRTFILHRLIRKFIAADGALRLQTKGDAQFEFDEPFTGNCLLGKVCAIEKKDTARRINLESLHMRVLNYLIVLFQKWKTSLKLLLQPGFNPVR